MAPAKAAPRGSTAIRAWSITCAALFVILVGCVCYMCQPPQHLYIGQQCQHHGWAFIDYNCPEDAPEDENLLKLWPSNNRYGSSMRQTSYEQIGGFTAAASSHGLREGVLNKPCHEDAAADQLLHLPGVPAGLVLQYKGVTAGYSSAGFKCGRSACTQFKNMGGKHAPYVFYTYGDVGMNSQWLQRQCSNGSMEVWVAPASWVLNRCDVDQEQHKVTVHALRAATAAAAEEAESAGVTDLVQRYRSFGVVQLSCNSSEAVGRELATLINGLLQRVTEDVPAGVNINQQMCTVSAAALPPPPPTPPSLPRCAAVVCRAVLSGFDLSHACRWQLLRMVRNTGKQLEGLA